jgi:hypothetical protein
VTPTMLPPHAAILAFEMRRQKASLRAVAYAIGVDFSVVQRFFVEREELRGDNGLMLFACPAGWTQSVIARTAQTILNTGNRQAILDGST